MLALADTALLVVTVAVQSYTQSQSSVCDPDTWKKVWTGEPVGGRFPGIGDAQCFSLAGRLLCGIEQAIDMAQLIQFHFIPRGFAKGSDPVLP